MHRIKIFICISLLLTFTAAPLNAEYVFTKDGAIKEGEIISENASLIVLYTKDKRRLTINRDDIMRILYTELYMGNILYVIWWMKTVKHTPSG